MGVIRDAISRLAPASDDAELRSEARRRFPQGTPAVPPPVQESIDESGRVRVAVSRQGRLVEVAINARWRDSLTAGQLVDALFATYQTATEQAAQLSALARIAARDRGEEPARLGDHPPVRYEPGHIPDPATDRAAWSQWIEQVRADTQAQRERRNRVSADDTPSPRAGPNGLLTSVSRGIQVLELTGDEERIWNARTSSVEEDALAVLSVPVEPSTFGQGGI